METRRSQCRSQTTRFAQPPSVNSSHTAPIRLADYDPRWPRLYEREALRIRRALGRRALLVRTARLPRSRLWMPLPAERVLERDVRHVAGDGLGHPEVPVLGKAPSNVRRTGVNSEELPFPGHAFERRRTAFPKPQPGAGDQVFDRP